MSDTKVQQEIPRGNAAGFARYLKDDITSGFLVFLIALPLCLGISVASGYPPLAGIFTAIIGSILTTFISNSEMTIKGPAAGLIVIAVGCIEDFGGNSADPAANLAAYKAAIAVGVVAAVLQILSGLFRAGILGEFFPGTVVHGMLAAIGVIIISKQIPVALGVTDAKGSPLGLLRQVPDFVVRANPAIALIGGISIAIMFFWPAIRKAFPVLKPVPAPLVVLLVSIPMGMGFDLLTPHSYILSGHEYQLNEQYLVKMPDRAFGMFQEITFPNFSVLSSLTAWKWISFFFIIGSLESLLSAKAVDLLDPWRRKTNMNRDMLAVGVANLACSMVGGLPMISEIVRSKANIDNGAKTRFADMWHGIFLLACVALIPTILHRIPLAALAAMLVYTGTRLAHPNEFLNVYRIGKEQLLIFVITLVTVLATDLLIGVAAGVIVKIIVHLANGVPLKSFFKAYVDVQDIDDSTSLIIARESAVFSNWIPFRRQIEDIGLVQNRNIIVDMSDAVLVDATVMEKLEEVSQEFRAAGLKFELRGLDSMRAFSANAHSTRKKGLSTARRLTIVTDADLARRLETEFVRLGASGYTEIPCVGVGRRQLNAPQSSATPQIRIEIILAAHTCDAILEFLRKEVSGTDLHLTACVETVDVPRISDFTTLESPQHSSAH